ncbi:MAG: transglutaminase-like domain-containing protein [Clostridiales Family XIII bacterium]|jgi:DNA gyrase inhibitor GyrI|nr:transglutaminase-like domain-containing protein [Clostridiales Family XIII bacterium]
MAKEKSKTQGKAGARLLAFLVTMALVAALLPVADIPATAAENGALLPQYCETTEELKEKIAEYLSLRTASFELTCPPELEREWGKSPLRLVDEAEKLCEDSIRWGRGKTHVEWYTDDGKVTINYTVTYHTTNGKDAAARKYATELVKWLDIGNLSERGKVDVICEYVNENLGYDSSKKSKTEYDTFVLREGTCMGLSLSTKMLLTEAGIESKVITGGAYGVSTHMWLIAKIDGYWYVIDATRLDSASHLAASIDAGKYIADAEFKTESFKEAHPVKSTAAA